MSTTSPSQDSDGAGTASEAGKRHSSLYFANGDLVVSAQDPTGERHIFRVHTVILGQHSPIFAAMLAIPAGPGGREAYDGVPLVHFPDDATDVAKLFEVFYNPGYVPPFKISANLVREFFCVLVFRSSSVTIRTLPLMSTA